MKIKLKEDDFDNKPISKSVKFSLALDVIICIIAFFVDVTKV